MQDRDVLLQSQSRIIRECLYANTLLSASLPHSLGVYRQTVLHVRACCLTCTQQLTIKIPFFFINISSTLRSFRPELSAALCRKRKAFSVLILRRPFCVLYVFITITARAEQQ